MDNGPISHFPLPAASSPASFRKSYSFVKVQCDTFVGYYHAALLQKPLYIPATIAAEYAGSQKVRKNPVNTKQPLTTSQRLSMNARMLFRPYKGADPASDASYSVVTPKYYRGFAYWKSTLCISAQWHIGGTVH
jgi:hypothetical protein